MTLDHAPVIDYSAHPAFAKIPPAPFDAEADRLIVEIDASYKELCTVPRPASERQEKFDREVAARIETLQNHLSARAREEFRHSLRLAFESARRLLRDDLSARDFSASGRNDQVKLRGDFQGNLDSFRRQGFFRFMDSKLARRVWSALPLERALLRLLKKQIPTRHCVLSIHAYSPAGRLIQRFARTSGLVDFASAYTGKPMEFYYAALDHAHSGQIWYQDCYADVGLTTSKTVYMHTDADFEIIKTMLYVQDVSEKDGAFCFIPGSHRWARSPLTLAIQKGFDATAPSVFAGNPHNGEYYRPRFKLADHRQDVLALPASLRGSTHFGDDVLDGSALSEALLEAEETFVAPAGTIVVFDGSRGIHRGGLVQPGGQRWAMQLAFRVRRDPPQSTWQAVSKELYGSLSYAKYVVTRLFGLACGRFLP
jgi:hypothetical protein